MLQVIMFALLLGVAISKSGKQGESLASFFEDLTNVILKMVTILLQLAPYGVFCLLAKIFSNQGSDAFLGLGQYFSPSFSLYCYIAFLFIHSCSSYLHVLTQGSFLENCDRLNLSDLALPQAARLYP